MAGHEKAARRRPVAGQEELGAALLALLLELRLDLGPLAVQRDDVGCSGGQFIGREVEASIITTASPIEEYEACFRLSRMASRRSGRAGRGDQCEKPNPRNDKARTRRALG